MKVTINNTDILYVDEVITTIERLKLLYDKTDNRGMLQVIQNLEKQIIKALDP